MSKLPKYASVVPIRILLKVLSTSYLLQNLAVFIYCFKCTKGTILPFIDIINCDVDDSCHDNATCTDANGNYTCACKDGFTGDGFNCTGETFGHSL